MKPPGGIVHGLANRAVPMGGSDGVSALYEGQSWIVKRRATETERTRRSVIVRVVLAPGPHVPGTGGSTRMVNKWLMGPQVVERTVTLPGAVALLRKAVDVEEARP